MQNNMNLFQALYYSLFGSWALLRGKQPPAFAYIVSVQGFVQSFAAILFVAPVFWIIVQSEAQFLIAQGEDASGAANLTLRLLALSLEWALFPILMALVAYEMGLKQSYIPYIIAYNWGSVFAVVSFGLFAALGLAGLISLEMLSLVYLGLTIATFVMRYHMARKILGVDAFLSICIVVGDMLLALSIGYMLGTVNI
jgi:hypothetical protein